MWCWNLYRDKFNWKLDKISQERQLQKKSLKISLIGNEFVDNRNIFLLQSLYSVILTAQFYL